MASGGDHLVYGCGKEAKLLAILSSAVGHVVFVGDAGGDGSKIARFGEWQNGEGDYFHNLTVGFSNVPPCVGFERWHFRKAIVQRFYYNEGF